MVSEWRAFSGKLALLLLLAFSLLPAHADTVGSVFVTGHDPDFHAFLGPNPAGAEHIIQDALPFVRMAMPIRSF